MDTRLTTHCCKRHSERTELVLRLRLRHRPFQTQAQVAVHHRLLVADGVHTTGIAQETTGATPLAKTTLVQDTHFALRDLR